MDASKDSWVDRTTVDADWSFGEDLEAVVADWSFGEDLEVEPSTGC